MRRIAVVGVPGAWSTEMLASRVELLSGRVSVIDMGKVVTDFERGTVLHQGEDLAGYDALMVKKVGSEYAPVFRDRLCVLSFLASRGVRVFSPPEKMMRLVDRLECTMALRKAGVPMPPTTVAEDTDLLMDKLEEYGTAVLKPLFTSRARGMALVERGPAGRRALEEFMRAGNPLVYMQKKVDIPGRDLGVAFLGHRYLGTYARLQGKGSWNTTIRAGGRYVDCRPSREVLETAERARRVFDLDFTCVDLVETVEGPMVFEVSAFGGFRGLLEGCGIDAARAYAQYAMEVLGNG